jgi:hypothetical protein
MAFSELERARHERTLNAWIDKQRPPPHIRPKLDLAYRIVGQSVEVFEVRPAFQKPGATHEGHVAKATWSKRHALWKIYWMRADLKWHRYEPVESAETLGKFLAVVRKDVHACFFG